MLTTLCVVVFFFQVDEFGIRHRRQRDSAAAAVRRGAVTLRIGRRRVGATSHRRTQRITPASSRQITTLDRTYANAFFS